jgi:hypothetical protein
MTDEELTQAIAELQEVVRCYCDEAFRDRGLQDPQCQCDSAEAVKVVASRIEALTAKLAKAVEGLEAMVQHEASTFFGPDGEKNKRASWRGVMRKVRATLAEIKGESHE